MKTINKDKITKILDFLAKKYQLFAPTEVKDWIDFAPVNSSKEVTFNYLNSKEAPKKLFFPQSETLFSTSKDGKMTVPESKNQQRVIFGLRPCDISSLIIMDKIFDAKDYQDPYYLEKRNNSILFTLACNEPASSCFCTSFNLGPYFKDYTDVFVVDLGKKYLFEAISPKGEKILKEIPGLSKAGAEDIKQIDKLKSAAESMIKKKLDVEGLPEKLKDLFDDPVWEEIQEKCLGCGICTHSCPTCHCFDLVDEKDGDGSKRVRIWDSCMYSLFTQEASGHNPRGTKHDRMRHRIMHKFCYFAENHNILACVGCGRCLRKCPGCMDIVRAIEKINSVAKGT